MRRPKRGQSRLPRPCANPIARLRLLGESNALAFARCSDLPLRMSLRGDLAELPLYEVDKTGRAEQLTSLALVHPHGSCMSLANTG
jgi:hypothetical protein